VSDPASNSTNGSPRWRIAGRVLLTLLALYVFGYLLVLLAGVHASFRKSQQARQNPSPVYLDNGASSVTPTQAEVFWPEFPHTSPSGLTQSQINGVEVLTEDWECAATPTEVLGYYRQQMIARGWRDATEETFGLQPELRDSQALQQEAYLQLYQKVMDSSLVLKRGQWSMQVLTERRKGTLSGTRVKIYAAATPAIKEFFASLVLGSPTSSNPDPGTRWIEATQFSGKDRYHTTIQTSPLDPTRALEETVAKFQADGWHPLMTPASSPSGQGYCLWLTKGNHYTVIMADRSASGQGSSVSVTEVTSNSGQ